jgi:hypothetical protein
VRQLDRPRARLERAKVHSSAFGEVWNRFLGEEDPYFPIVEIDDEGEGTIHVRANERLPRDQLSLHFGEMLYQLRAALDSLVYEVAIQDTGEDPPPRAESLEFIIRSSESAFDKAAWKIRPLSDLHQAMILSIQPYEVEGRGKGERFVADVLAELNDLARKDRHRGLRVIAGWVANKNPILYLPPGCSTEWIDVTPDGHLNDEGVLARFKVSGWRPEYQIEANPNCTVDVSVEDVAPPVDDEDTLSARARTMIACVSEVIGGFEKTLGV